METGVFDELYIEIQSVADGTLSDNITISHKKGRSSHIISHGSYAASQKVLIWSVSGGLKSRQPAVLLYGQGELQRL